MIFVSVFCAQARGKKRQSGLFPANHVKILDRKATPPASPATEDVSINPTICAYGILMRQTRLVPREMNLSRASRRTGETFYKIGEKQDACWEKW